MKNSVYRRLLGLVNNYLVFFLLVAFVVSCCMMLFISTLSVTMGLSLNKTNLASAAKLTFANVLLLTSLFTAIDYVRRKLSFERPVKRIIAATEQIMHGDFSVRISPLPGNHYDFGLNQVISAINKMAQELAGTETLRSDFIANVSHELKTPLAVMGNYASMLQKDGLSAQQRLEYAAAISAASGRLAQLISNILKLNKLENQQIFPSLQEFDLSEQLRSCLLQFEDTWEKKQLNLNIDIEDSVLIRSDAELLGLVWTNLISNAVKFTPPGGSIEVRLRAQSGHIIVSVRDSGCGMDANTGTHIFEKFYQGDNSHSTEGNGLGLALVKRVVDILKAEISVESAPGQGSCFSVKLARRI